jgi:hypothetical protein
LIPCLLQLSSNRIPLSIALLTSINSSKYVSRDRDDILGRIHEDESSLSMHPVTRNGEMTRIGISLRIVYVGGAVRLCISDIRTLLAQIQLQILRSQLLLKT